MTLSHGRIGGLRVTSPSQAAAGRVRLVIPADPGPSQCECWGQFRVQFPALRLELQATGGHGLTGTV